MNGKAKDSLVTVARAGFIAKGVIYILIGVIAFLAAFRIGNKSNTEATSKGAFHTVGDLPAGVVLLGLLALGLICYTIWRFVQAATVHESDAKKSVGKRIRYVLSGLAYGSLAFTAGRLLFEERSGNKDRNQELATTLLQQSYGQLLAIALGLVFAGIGIYQVYYGLKEKYKKHVGSISGLSGKGDLLLKAAKLGYIARGAVWLIVAFLFLRAAMHLNSSEAGDTGKAFQFIGSGAYGTVLLAVLAIGVVMYGVFNFVRAGYERFEVG